MTPFPLEGRKIAILSTLGFEFTELIGPKYILEGAGAEVKVIAPDLSHYAGFTLREGLASDKHIQGMSGTDWSGAVAVDLRLDKANAADYDALHLPGGVFNPDILRNIEGAISFIKAFAEKGKLISAICHGPWSLINAGLVKGRKMTSWPSLRVDLQNAGALWEDSEVVEDGNFITSRRPSDIPVFGRAIIRALTKAMAVPPKSGAAR
jgi:protease I